MILYQIVKLSEFAHPTVLSTFNIPTFNLQHPNLQPSTSQPSTFNIPTFNIPTNQTLDEVASS
ncbi:hypothetical protein, partial [Moorena producens]